MTDSGGSKSSPRAGRALPARWQLLAAAVAVFLVYTIVVTIAEWTGLRSPPPPEPLSAEATPEQVKKVISAKFGQMRRGEFSKDVKRRLADGEDVRPHERMVDEIFRLAERLRGMDKASKRPRCLTTNECENQEVADKEERLRMARAAEARATKACDARARDYQVAEELALDASFDPRPGGVGYGDRLYGHLVALARKEQACVQRKEHEEAVGRHLRTLAGLVTAPAPAPGDWKVGSEHREALRRANVNVYSLLQAYDGLPCWYPAAPRPKITQQLEDLVREEYAVAQKAGSPDALGAAAQAVRQRLLPGWAMCP